MSASSGPGWLSMSASSGPGWLSMSAISNIFDFLLQPLKIWSCWKKRNLRKNVSQWNSFS